MPRGLMFGGSFRQACQQQIELAQFLGDRVLQAPMTDLEQRQLFARCSPWGSLLRDRSFDPRERLLKPVQSGAECFRRHGMAR